ncbi:FAD-dependent oxidoreductase [Nocardioides acrostichi]|uniref:ferredoxin--NADP(+) reductase n=1 Tax=Nocardioides acrostichi TaxID=2784339 RepID=A0A930Y7P6_9ACTN|nr:FAD-dependent oxidoreductase [Nocardioides acrostichi]MBF4162216.1 FAD-dependent oxidoreductase [Nocardioides acrostichi]
MTHVVTQPCCADASCVLACPVNCIHPAPGEPGFGQTEMVYVDPAGCVDCGACVTACPVGAIVPHTSLSPGQRPFADLAVEYYEAFPHADRVPLAIVSPPRRLRERRPVRVAVVGAGPAGLYAADELLRHPSIGVDVIDAQPVPHGLARAGVAADHESTRRVTGLFEKIERQPGFGYRLSTRVDDGSGVLDDYDAVIWATGAGPERRLDIPGEHLPGVVGGTALARWWNRDPGQPDPAPGLAGARSAVIVGMGNVALDVARMLVLDPGGVVGTSVSEVVVLARRGPAHAAFTLPEVVGLVGLATDGLVEVAVEPGGAALDPSDPKQRLLAGLPASVPGARGRIVLRFEATPTRVSGERHVEAVELADGTRLAADLVVHAIGHEPSGIVHERGRTAPGRYVVGWAKRGASGGIGANKACAEETVASLLDDLEAGLLGVGAREYAAVP